VLLSNAPDIEEAEHWHELQSLHSLNIAVFSC